MKRAIAWRNNQFEEFDRKFLAYRKQVRRDFKLATQETQDSDEAKKAQLEKARVNSE